MARTVTSTSGSLTLKISAQLSFDGTLEYQAALSSTSNVNLADVRLELPMRNEAVRYFMGMNLKWSNGASWRRALTWPGAVGASSLPQ